MASPRITKQIREQIVENTLDHTFKARKEKLVKEHAALAERAYKELYKPSLIKAMEELGEKFICKEDDIQLNMKGQRRRLNFNGNFSYRLSDIPRVYKLMEKTQGQNALVPSDKLFDAIDSHFDAVKAFDTEHEKASVNLSAMLESVQTFKKLRAIWPEGEKFYDMYDVDSEKPGVPAIFVSDLNKMLGL